MEGPLGLYTPGCPPFVPGPLRMFFPVCIDYTNKYYRTPALPAHSRYPRSSPFAVPNTSPTPASQMLQRGSASSAPNSASVGMHPSHPPPPHERRPLQPVNLLRLPDDNHTITTAPFPRTSSSSKNNNINSQNLWTAGHRPHRHHRPRHLLSLKCNPLQ